MKERSYTEFMKSGAMKRMKQKESYVLDLYIDMLLQEALLNREKKKLVEQVDQALDQRDKDTFIRLSAELNQLNKRFGT